MISSSVEPFESYTGNGTTAVYGFGFPTFKNSDIVAYITDPDGTVTKLVYGTDYTLTGITTSNGTLTLVDAGQAWIDGGGFLDADYILDILFSIDAVEQPSRFTDLGYRAPATFEKAVDRLTMYILALLNNEGSIESVAADFLATAYTPSIQTLSAGGSIALQRVKRQHIRVQSDGGAIALANAVFGVDTSKFVDGMVVILEGLSDIDTVQQNSADVAYGVWGNGNLIYSKKIMATYCYNAAQQRFKILSIGGAC